MPPSWARRPTSRPPEWQDGARKSKRHHSLFNRHKHRLTIAVTLVSCQGACRNGCARPALRAQGHLHPSVPPSQLGLHAAALTGVKAHVVVRMRAASEADQHLGGATFAVHQAGCDACPNTQFHLRVEVSRCEMRDDGSCNGPRALSDASALPCRVSMLTPSVVAPAVCTFTWTPCNSVAWMRQVHHLGRSTCCTCTCARSSSRTAVPPHCSSTAAGPSPGLHTRHVCCCADNTGGGGLHDTSTSGTPQGVAPPATTWHTPIRGSATCICAPASARPPSLMPWAVR